MLDLKEVSKSYVQGVRSVDVLKGVNLSLAPGEIVAIMGRSGSGKSTLLSLISGILKSDSGHIFLNNQQYESLNERELSDLRAEHIGFVFQNFHLVTYLNALENVMLPAQVCKKDHPRERAIKLLTQVGLKERIDHLPGELSGGEKQRVAIARALVHEPKLILADEPSGSLDVDTGEEVMDALFDMVRANGTGLILVTHSPKVAKRCSKIYSIKEGLLKEHVD